MKDYIATDSEGRIVGKWRQNSKPDVPPSVKEVDNVEDYTVDYWWDEQS